MLLLIASAFLLFMGGVRAENKYCCWSGIFMMVLANIVVLTLPLTLGHWATNNMDNLEHIGYTRSILAGYFSGTEVFNPYPLFHTIPAIISAASGLEPNVSVALMPALMGVVYVLGMYWLAKLLFQDDYKRLMLVFLSTILIIPYSTVVSQHYVPLVLPLVLCAVINAWKQPNIGWIALLLAVMAVAPFYHPELLAAVIISIGVIIAVDIRSRQTLLLIPVFIVGFGVGWVYAQITNIGIYWSIHDIPFQLIKVVQGKSVAEYVGITVMVLSPVVAALWCFKTKLLSPTLKVMALSLLACLSLYALHLLNVGPEALERALYCIPVFALPLVARVSIKMVCSKAPAVVVAVLILMLVSFHGAATIHASPYVWYTYRQMEEVKASILEHNPHGYEKLLNRWGPDNARKVSIALLGQHWYREFHKKYGY